MLTVDGKWEIKAGELISVKIYFSKQFQIKSCKATFTLSQNIFNNKKIVKDVKLKMLAIKNGERLQTMCRSYVVGDEK